MAGSGPRAPGQRRAATGVRELDPLVARFNQVLERMDEGLTRERRFAGGLAHETRTRLAELRILCEVESRYPTGRPQADLLDELGRIGAELEATVQALLLLTRLQAGIERPRWHEVEPAALLERLAQRLRPEAARRGVQLRIDIDEPNLPWRSDAALLEVVLGNLLGNACYYAPAGDTVRVRLRGRELSIDNAAPSLDVEDLRHFGQHFWRKQLPDSGHSGLGLALVSAAARALDLSLDYRLTDGRLHVRIIGAPKTDDDAHSPA
jgi:signal transduction histidine kinase